MWYKMSKARKILHQAEYYVIKDLGPGVKNFCNVTVVGEPVLWGKKSPSPGFEPGSAAPQRAWVSPRVNCRVTTTPAWALLIIRSTNDHCMHSQSHTLPLISSDIQSILMAANHHVLCQKLPYHTREVGARSEPSSTHHQPALPKAPRTTSRSTIISADRRVRC